MRREVLRKNFVQKAVMCASFKNLCALLFSAPQKKWHTQKKLFSAPLKMSEISEKKNEVLRKITRDVFENMLYVCQFCSKKNDFFLQKK
jgi:hypothetical protein